VPVRITCPAGFNRPEGGSGPIEQAAGQAIAHANVGDSAPNQTLICDGAPHQNSFTVMADPTGPPFHAGEAAIRISLNLCDVNFVCLQGTSGFVVIQLRI
jgi:hypothetical protein